MSSQFVIMPLSMGCLTERMLLLLWASSPTNTSPLLLVVLSVAPGLVRGLPTTHGKIARAESAPAQPALIIHEPLSITKTLDIPGPMSIFYVQITLHNSIVIAYQTIRGMQLISIILSLLVYWQGNPLKPEIFKSAISQTIYRLL